MDHAPYLQRCLQLARLGGRQVFPNPYVGAVIRYQDKIIGEGYHARYKGPHAEVRAVDSVKDKELLKDSTLYVSLEPCNIHRNTPPCTRLILAHGIPRVVVGCKDPNPEIAGSGLDLLRSRGVEVHMAEDPTPFIDLNRRFFVNHYSRRPYITLKWAESMDGFIGKLDKNERPHPVAITGFESRSLVHRLRASHHGIMVGTTTAAVDNPSLTNRLYYGGSPVRLILDRHLRLPHSLTLFSDAEVPTMVLTEKKRESPSSQVQYLSISPWPSQIEDLLSHLYAERGITSVLIEGGSNLLQQLIDEGCYDEIFRFQGNITIRKGVPAPTLPKDFAFDEHNPIGVDWLSTKKRVLSMS